MTSKETDYDVGSEEFSQELLDSIMQTEEFNTTLDYVQQVSPRFRDLPMSTQCLSVAMILSGKTQGVPALEDMIYKYEPPSIDEFLSEKYLGPLGGMIYEPWKKVLIEAIFNPNSAVYEWILGGCIGAGKSTIALVAHFYNLTRINCLRSPQLTMGSAPTKSMNLQLMSVTMDKVGSTLMGQIEGMLNACPMYIEVKNKQEGMMHEQQGTGFIPWWWEDGNIAFPNNVYVKSGSQDWHALGEDLFGAVLDEAEFRRGGDINATFDLYANILERIRSRFLGCRFILMTMVSSVQSDDGVIAKHVKSIEPGDPYRHVTSFAIWDVKPEFAREMEKGHFWVMRGTKTHPSRVLSDEEGALVDEGTYVVPAGCRLIKVPLRFKSDFKTNVERALKNLAGVTTQGDEKPFDDLTGIEDVGLPPEVTIVAPLRETRPLRYQLPQDAFYKTPDGMRLKRYPMARRYIHCDLADTGEAGIGICHKEISRQGQIIYTFDFVLRITSPNRISFESVNEFLIDLRDVYGINIHTLTADQYQSVSTLQKMETEHVAEKVFRLSVDTTAVAYYSGSNAIADGSVRTGVCPLLKAQLGEVYIHKNKPFSRERKDVADGAIGALYNAMQNAADVPSYVYEDFGSADVIKQKMSDEGYQEI